MQARLKTNFKTKEYDIERRDSNWKVAGSLVRFLNWQCVVVSLERHFTLIAQWDQAVDPLWWSTLTKNLQTETKTGALHWSGYPYAECLVHMNESQLKTLKTPEYAFPSPLAGSSRAS